MTRRMETTTDEKAGSELSAEMAGGERSQKVRRKPSIVGMKIRRNMADHIVDLDLFENQHFKAKALQLAASSRIKRRSLQRKVEPEPGPVFGLGMELDGGVGMVGLQPVDADFDMDVGQQRKWLQKRDLSPTGHWMSTLSIGFSRVDVSLCVLLYFLSCMCLLGMYTFFQHRFRLRRVKFSMSCVCDWIAVNSPRRCLLHTGPSDQMSAGAWLS